MATQQQDMFTDQTFSDLPPYSVDADGLPTFDQLERLPSREYGTNSLLTEHTIALPSNRGEPWLKMFLSSLAPTPSGHPVFIGHLPIRGRVELDLSKPKDLKKITLMLRGATTNPTTSRTLFLNREYVVWKSAKGVTERFTSGKHSWPINISFPERIEIENKEYALPPSFSEINYQTSVQYRLMLVVQGSWLRGEYTMMTPLLFAPPTFAEPPSPLQQLAYREGQQALLGPKADPDGWHEVSGKIRGTVFKAREVELSYTVAIAKPLSFALRSYIPVIVTMQCDDVEALRLLSQPSSIVLFLIRRITTGASAMIEGRHPSSEIFLDRTSNAYFWREPGASDDADDTRRVLRGEIPIEVTAKSTVVFPHFTIQHRLELMCPTTPGFKMSKSQASSSQAGRSQASGTNGTGQAFPPSLLFSQPITIATKNAAGMSRARSFAPPGYVKPQPHERVLHDREVRNVKRFDLVENYDLEPMDELW